MTKYTFLMSSGIWFSLDHNYLELTQEQSYTMSVDIAQVTADIDAALRQLMTLFEMLPYSKCYS